MIKLFDEIYSKYYQIINELICKCVEKTYLSEEEARKVMRKKGFSAETEWIVIDQIKAGKWSVLKYDNQSKNIFTPFDVKPAILPFDHLEKSWMKALLYDPKMQLFETCDDGLENVAPLFTADDYKVFDKVIDADSYDDERYKKSFKIICDAIANGYAVHVKYTDQYGCYKDVYIQPKHLEYSLKDDKFRIIAAYGDKRIIINLSSVTFVEYCSGQEIKNYSSKKAQRQILGIELTDERNSLERAATHFSQYAKKQIKRMSENRYYVEYEYDDDVENEIVMKVISFGETIKVVKPTSVIEKIRARLERQKYIIDS